MGVVVQGIEQMCLDINVAVSPAPQHDGPVHGRQDDMEVVLLAIGASSVYPSRYEATLRTRGALHFRTLRGLGGWTSSLPDDLLCVTVVTRQTRGNVIQPESLAWGARLQ
jgi:hypothetical protein